MQWYAKSHYTYRSLSLSLLFPADGRWICDYKLVKVNRTRNEKSSSRDGGTDQRISDDPIETRRRWWSWQHLSGWSCVKKWAYPSSTISRVHPFSYPPLFIFFYRTILDAGTTHRRLKREASRLWNDLKHLFSAPALATACGYSCMFCCIVNTCSLCKLGDCLKLLRGQ